MSTSRTAVWELAGALSNKIVDAQNSNVLFIVTTLPLDQGILSTLAGESLDAFAVSPRQHAALAAACTSCGRS
jgi:hypothetical protein